MNTLPGHALRAQVTGDAPEAYRYWLACECGFETTIYEHNVAQPRASIQPMLDEGVDHYRDVMLSGGGLSADGMHEILMMPRFPKE